MKNTEIRRWLEETSKNSRQTKRRRLCQLTTPPQSMDSPDVRLDDETPRAKRVRSDLTGSSRSVGNYSSSSARSGRSSLKQQVRRLRHDPHGLDMRPLWGLSDLSDVPPCLETFLDSINAFAQGRKIVAASAYDTLHGVAASNAGFRWVMRASDFLDADLQGFHTPSPWKILKVVEAAAECSRRNYSEATWNVEVHYRILEMALRPAKDHKMFRQLVNFTLATTATIIPNYGNPAASKRVDVCLYIDPENDSTGPLSSQYRAAVEMLRDTLPCEVVNFTEFDAFEDRFVAVSVETKKPGEDTEAGKLQLGVWEMARWNFLRRLAAAGRHHEAPRQLPPFLPSILVDGNEWYLLLTTAEGEKTVLWHKQLIGSTSETIGVYQIVRTLQYMAQWARDVHWPYLRSLVESHAGDHVQV